jgi:hypothetical protein
VVDNQGSKGSERLLKVLSIVAISLGLAFVPGTVAAQSTGTTCAVVADDMERLACYDAIFLDQDPAAEGETVVIRSEQLIPAVPTGRGNATMTVACNAGELSVRFGFAGNVLAPTGSNTGISLQRDLLRAEARTLPPNDAGTELVIAGNRDVITFLNSLQGVTNLGARVTPANSRSLNVRFRVVGIVEQVRPLVSTCR